MKKLLVLFLVTLFIIQEHVAAFVEEESVGIAKSEGLRPINCIFTCSRRCIMSSRGKLCNRACLSCCAQCNCVPSGTYGNRAQCPCYAQLRTHGNKLKCP